MVLQPAQDGPGLFVGGRELIRGGRGEPVECVESRFGHRVRCVLECAQPLQDGPQEGRGQSRPVGVGDDVGVVGGDLDGAVADGQVAPDAAAVLRLGAEPRGETVEGGVAHRGVRSPAEGAGVESVERLKRDAAPVGHGEDLRREPGHGGTVTVDQVGHGRVGEGGGGEHGAESGLGPQIPLDVVTGPGRTPALQVGDEGADAVADGGTAGFADDEGSRAAVLDHPGLGDVGEDVDEGGDGAVGTDEPGYQVLVEAVLHGDDVPVRGQAGGDPLDGAPGGLRLHREQDAFERSGEGVGGGRGDRDARATAVGGGEDESVGADRVDVRGVGVDEGDGVARAGEGEGEGAADRSRADDGVGGPFPGGVAGVAHRASSSVVVAAARGG